MKNKSMIKISLFAAMIIAIFFLNKYYGWSKYLSNTENQNKYKIIKSVNIKKKHLYKNIWFNNQNAKKN